jgi:hypothetical protein
VRKRKSLVAFDTNHIKSYVFGTDRLKEIRGASALLDKLNREDMLEIARRFCQEKEIEFETRDVIYLNGGSGLFLLMTDENTASEFGERVQKRYHEATYSGASITFVVHELPENSPDDRTILWHIDLHKEFEIIRYCLREAKSNPLNNNIITLPSHPFIRSCDSCGINYASHRVAGYGDFDDTDDTDDTGYYCTICYEKQRQNNRDKKELYKLFRKSKSYTNQNINQQGLWQRILYYLNQTDYANQFTQSNRFPERPKDFNMFRNFTGGKEYLGLIYADANNMGARIEKLTTLDEQAQFAAEVDGAIHDAMSKAINKHLPLLSKDNKKSSNLFPFDILLLGGDDIVMVTDASKAVPIAHTIASEFYAITQKSTKIKAELKPCTLSIGVTLAPIKYPFNLLLDMTENALKAAKEGSFNARTKAEEEKTGQINDSRINFVVVTGGSVKNFDDLDKKIYKSSDGKNYFYATLRPYDLDSLNRLLTAIKEGHKRNLGRTKLHALREAVLKKNLTTSVSDSLAVLRNWHEEQRKFVMTSLYESYAAAVPTTNIKDPTNGFPRITFPWFADPQDRNVYRTTFLDFVELYDFVNREDGNV